MSFASPAFLAGLLLVPVLIAAYVRHERRGPVFATPALMPSVVRRPAGWRRHAALVGYAAAVVALLVSLAKPQATIAVPTQRARVMIVTDRSGSMQATDLKPTRLQAAKRAVATFLKAVPDDLRVGAIAFNKTAEVLQSPTTDHAAINEALKAIEPHGRTATGDAIATALRALPANGNPAAIVLLTDGKSKLGTDPLTAAKVAAKRHIPIDTVAVGTANGTVKGKHVLSDPQTLAQIARVTGGKANTAADAGQLRQVYKRVASKVATARRKREVSDLFAGGALALMALSAFGSLGLRGRLV